MSFPAARLTDMHTCPMCMGAPLPVAGVTAVNVLIGGLPAARQTDFCACVAPVPVPVDPIVMGSPTVLIGGLPAAFMGSPTAKGGVILPPCCPTVLIGMVGMAPPVVPKMSMLTPGMPGAKPQNPGDMQAPTLLARNFSTGFQTKQASFADKFKAITGMTVEESIALYKADTGKDLDPATVETLFTDSAKAKQLLMADKDLHTAYRSILNSNVPATKEAAKAAGYTQPTLLGSKFLANWYHDPWNNEKWVSPDGHLEGVYDANGNLVNTLEYKGTFNFFGPDKTGDHKAADVDPYYEWGN